MYLFCADLDNTLIYSYKRDIGGEKTGVEMYQGRVISYMTDYTVRLLREAARRTLFVPTTTRTEEQYRRIDFGMETPRYALVCNGGVLLENGEEDAAWYRDSLRLAEPSRGELERGHRMLERDGRRIFELRCIRGLFIFTKCDEPEDVVRDLRGVLDLDRVDVFHNGAKVYIVPGQLNKGAAAARLREKTGADAVIAAGDSAFDVPMLERADCAIAPESLRGYLTPSPHLSFAGEREVFSEKVLEGVLEYVKKF